MSQYAPDMCWNQVLLCDTNPDSRQKLSRELTDLGYQILPTGNPQVASGLIQEKQFGSLIVFVLTQLKISMLATLVYARRCRPETPILIILDSDSSGTLPAELADKVLICPDSQQLSRTIKYLIQSKIPMATAS